MPSAASQTHLVLIPAFNAGPKLAETVAAAREVWSPVWVVDDASTDGSIATLKPEGIQLVRLEKNSGKGGAFLHGLIQAHREGFTHVLLMDSDGQHPAESIVPFMELSARHPGHMILGRPVFGEDAPAERVWGRKIGNWWAELETLGGGIRDSLFGFRVYPVEPALQIMQRIRTARRFDFDTELAVRLYWEGVPAINRPVRVYYPPQKEGGRSHFHYLRDNLLLVGTHTRLFFGMWWRLPRLIRWKFTRSQAEE